jgi:hypothetical protein
VFFDTKVSNKDFVHIFKYRRCKTRHVEINVEYELIKFELSCISPQLG